MNKQKRLTQLLIRQGIIAVVILAVCAGLYFLTDGMVDDSLKAKNDAESAFNADQGQIATLSGQISKSGIAEKRFQETQQGRLNANYVTDTDALKDYLRQAKAQYRFSNTFKLSLTNDKLSDNHEFAESGYDVFEHPGMKLEFSAISDVHLFSFLQDFTRNAPGFIRIDALTMKKTGEINPTTIGQMTAGLAPYLVDVTIEFNWIALREKAPKTPASPPAGAP